MDVERLVISKVIETRDFTPLAENNITATFFVNPESQKVFKTVLAHKSQYGEVPSLGAIKIDHPNYKFVKVEDDYGFLIHRLRENRKRVILESALETATSTLDKNDIAATTAAITQALSSIGQEVQSTRDVDLTLTGDTRLERYRTYKDFDGGLRGIPSGFASIDRATLGFQKQNLVTFVGPPKAGKSTTIVLAARAAHLSGHTPLVIGFEMSNEEQEERLDSIGAGINHRSLRAGELTTDEWKKLEKYLRGQSGMPRFMLSSDAASMMTLSGVAAKIDQINPDIVFIDGVYMMQDEQGQPQGSPQALTNLTRGFKRLAQARNIPIVISTQVLAYKISKKVGITADAIGYSSSFAQDSDTIIGVNQTEDESINELSIVLSRNSPKFKTYVSWDWSTGTFEELQADPFMEGDLGV